MSRNLALVGAVAGASGLAIWASLGSLPLFSTFGVIAVLLGTVLIVVSLSMFMRLLTTVSFSKVAPGRLLALTIFLGLEGLLMATTLALPVDSSLPYVMWIIIGIFGGVGVSALLLGLSLRRGSSELLGFRRLLPPPLLLLGGVRILDVALNISFSTADGTLMSAFSVALFYASSIGEVWFIVLLILLFVRAMGVTQKEVSLSQVTLAVLVAVSLFAGSWYNNGVIPGIAGM